MARFGLFVPGDELFSKLERPYQTGAAAVDAANEEEDTIREALEVLAVEGRLRQPAYM